MKCTVQYPGIIVGIHALPCLLSSTQANRRLPRLLHALFFAVTADKQQAAQGSLQVCYQVRPTVVVRVTSTLPHLVVGVSTECPGTCMGCFQGKAIWVLWPSRTGISLGTPPLPVDGGHSGTSTVQYQPLTSNTKASSKHLVASFSISFKKSPFPRARGHRPESTLLHQQNT